MTVFMVAAGAAVDATASDPPKPTAKSAMRSVARSVVYNPVNFADLPGWEQDDHLVAFKAFRKSCERILAAHERASGEAEPALVAVCQTAMTLAKPTKVGARAFFEQNFTANALAHDGPSGLLTGYYEPVIEGSRTAEGMFQTPIYKRPPDLVNLVDETRRSTAGSALSHARKTDKGIEPFATRAEIDQGVLKGRNLELMYFADPVDVFFMQIQGSGRVKLPDGSMVRVHYDGKNGHRYTSIGRYLIEKGIVAADKMSMDALSKWLKSDLERAKQIMWQNASYVFFRELKGEEGKGPLGAMNAPLTAGRSLAVDTLYHALGTPIYVSAGAVGRGSKAGPLHRLMVAQDVGSAIRGPERGDIYFGSGDAAGELAGTTKCAGSFIVLRPKEAPPRAASEDAPAQEAKR
jgi:membrane-bound lytic murein transglycosylase A